MTDLPIEKYPVNYKCTHIYDIANTLEKKYGLNFHNLKPKTPTRNSHHDFNFHDFISKKLQQENISNGSYFVYFNIEIPKSVTNYYFFDITNNAILVGFNDIEHHSTNIEDLKIIISAKKYNI